MAHANTQMVWNRSKGEYAIRYNGKSYDKKYHCPECGRETWQNLNFLGSRVLMCNGSKITKEQPNDN